MTDDLDPLPGWWAVVELTDHRKVAGLLSEQVVASTPFVRIDVPAGDGRQPTTQLYAPHAIYSITPIDEPVALSTAGRTRPAFPEGVVTFGTKAGTRDPRSSEPAGGQAPAERTPVAGSSSRDDRELLTVSELASRYTCSRSTVMRWQTFDDFPEPAVRGPRRLAVYELADVERFLAEHSELLRTYHRG